MILDYNYRMLSYSKEGNRLQHYPRTIAHRIDGKSCGSLISRHKKTVASSTA